MRGRLACARAGTDELSGGAVDSVTLLYVLASGDRHVRIHRWLCALDIRGRMEVSSIREEKGVGGWIADEGGARLRRRLGHLSAFLHTYIYIPLIRAVALSTPSKPFFFNIFFCAPSRGGGGRVMLREGQPSKILALLEDHSFACSTQGGTPPPRGVRPREEVPEPGLGERERGEEREDEDGDEPGEGEEWGTRAILSFLYFMSFEAGIAQVGGGEGGVTACHPTDRPRSGRTVNGERNPTISPWSR